VNRKVLITGGVAALLLLALLYSGLGTDPHQLKSALVGRQAPSFALKEVGTGRVVSLAGYRGKPIIINFWATWCVPCHQENPVLVAAARDAGQQVQFLGVVFEDDESKITQFLRENGSGYPTVMDEQGRTAIAYGVGGVPETFFVDASGKIVAKFEGPLSPDTLAAYLSKLGTRI
jgi:cytochrome c biogenesis protein CcmG/thiol:disulfide interchange protein DsbE